MPLTSIVTAATLPCLASINLSQVLGKITPLLLLPTSMIFRIKGTDTPHSNIAKALYISRIKDTIYLRDSIHRDSLVKRKLKTTSGIPWKGRAYLRKRYPGAFPLSEGQIQVLRGLAKEGPINTYRLAQKTGKAYSFVFNSLKELERRKMILIKRTDDTERGTKAKIYDMNLEGVLLILQREVSHEVKKRDHGFIRKIIESYSSFLPLVFGKWNYFKKTGLEKLFLLRLKITLDTHKYDHLRKGTGYFPWLEDKQQIVRFFYLFDFYRFEDHFINDFNVKTWLTALKEDKEIKDYMIRELKNERRRLENRQIRVDKVVLFMESHIEDENQV